ncbi:MAG: hypothetical protein GC154_21300 [bacterium]|nr:hypothetical protein [bacterium]
MGFQKKLWIICAAALCFTAPLSVFPHALNPDSIDRYVEITFAPDRIVLIYQLILGVNPTETAARRLDPDNDGEITDAERDAYLTAESRDFGVRQYLTLNGEQLELQYKTGDAYSGVGHNGISVIRLDLGYVAPIPADIPRGTTVEFYFKDFRLENVAGWKQIKTVDSGGTRYIGHVPYSEYQPFDWEILNEKGFYPSTDHLDGAVILPQAPVSSPPVEIVLPSQTAPKPQKPVTYWQYGVLAFAGLLILAFVAVLAVRVLTALRPR